MTRTIFAACTALAAIALPAAAQDEIDFTFEFDATQAQTIEGAQAVYGDLERRALDACATTGRLTLQERQAARECASDLVASVIAEANRPTLTAVHTEASTSIFAARENETVTQ